MPRGKRTASTTTRTPSTRNRRNSANAGEENVVNTEDSEVVSNNNSTERRVAPPVELGKRSAEMAELDSLNPENTPNNPGRGNNIIDFEQILINSDLCVLPRSSENAKNSQINVDMARQPILDTHNTGPHHVLNLNTQLNPLSTSESNQTIRLSNDDISAHIPTTLKQKICSGEYVNLALLLKGATDLSEHCNGSILRLSKDGRIESVAKECKTKSTR